MHGPERPAHPPLAINSRNDRFASTWVFILLNEASVEYLVMIEIATRTTRVVGTLRSGRQRTMYNCTLYRFSCCTQFGCKIQLPEMFFSFEFLVTQYVCGLRCKFVKLAPTVTTFYTCTTHINRVSSKLFSIKTKIVQIIIARNDCSSISRNCENVCKLLKSIWAVNDLWMQCNKSL